MKKLFALLLTLALLTGLAACGTPTPAATPLPTAAPEVTAAPTAEPEPPPTDAPEATAAPTPSQIPAIPVELTPELARADFDQLFDMITTSVPYLDDQKALFGWSFADRKEQYLAALEQASTNFEYYCVFYAMLADVPSCHTYVLPPSIAPFMLTAGYPDPDKLGSNETFLGKNLYLDEQFADETKTYFDQTVIAAHYVEGSYYITDIMSPDGGNGYEAFADIFLGRLTSIKGYKSVADFANTTLNCYKLQYDFQNKIQYRSYLAFNDRYGIPLDVTIELADGSKVTRTLYYSIPAYMALNMQPGDGSDEPEHYTHFTDDVNKLEYLHIYDMNFTSDGRDSYYNAGKEIYALIQDFSPEYNIVIDLRNNGGGVSTMMSDYIYPALYGGARREQRMTFTILKTSYMESYIALMRLDGGMSKKDLGDTVEYSFKETFNGRSTVKDRKIYYLINDSSASATDRYIGFVKSNNLGTIIGSNNTAGEGLGASPPLAALDNSGFVFQWFPFYCVNDEGLNNSVYGTAPDVYVPYTWEDWTRTSEHDPDSYEYLLDVLVSLKKAIELNNAE